MAWHSSWEADKERREQRAEYKASKPSARRGGRKPEWLCSRCGRTNFMDLATCRGKDCAQHRDPRYDTYINEYAEKSSWPTEYWTPARRVRSPSKQGTQTARPSTYAEAVAPRQPTPHKQLQALRQQLADAKRLGWDDATVDFLQQRVMAIEQEQMQQRPLGQRLDQKRAALRRACDRAEAALTQVAEWQSEVEKAKEEVIALERDVTLLSQEASLHANLNPVQQIAQTLGTLAQAVEGTWALGTSGENGGVPVRLAQALKASHAALAELQALSARCHMGPEVEPSILVADTDDEDMLDAAIAAENAEQSAKEEQPDEQQQQQQAQQAAQEGLAPPVATGSAPNSPEQRRARSGSRSPRPAKLLRFGSGTASGRVQVKAEHSYGDYSSNSGAENDLSDIVANARRHLQPMGEVQQP